MPCSSPSTAPCSAAPVWARAIISWSASTAPWTRSVQPSPRLPPRGHHGSAVPALPDGRLLPGRHRPAGRRGASGARDRVRGWTDGRSCTTTPSPSRGRAPLDLGHRRGLRDGVELRRRRARRPRRVRFPALAELSGDFAPGGAWLGVRALGLALRAGDGRGPSTALRERVPAHFGTPTPRRPHWRLQRHTPLCPALRAGPGPPRRGRRRRPPLRCQAADVLADEVARLRPRRRRPARPARRARSKWSSAAASSTPPTPASMPGSPPASSRAPPGRSRPTRRPPVLGAALIGLDAIGRHPRAVVALTVPPSPARLNRFSPPLGPRGRPSPDRSAPPPPPAAPAPHVRHGIGHEALVVGQQRVGEVLDHGDDLRVLLGVPALEELGQTVPPRLGQLVERRPCPPARVQVAFGAPRRRSSTMPAPATRPPPAWISSASTFKPLRHVVAPCRPAGRPSGRAASRTAAADRCRPAAPASGTARPGSPGRTTGRAPAQSPAATTAVRAMPFASPMSTVWTVLRSSTSGRSQLRRNATNAIGTATRKTT